MVKDRMEENGVKKLYQTFSSPQIGEKD